jgi:uncharacterized membrane protein
VKSTPDPTLINLLRVGVPGLAVGGAILWLLRGQMPALANVRVHAPDFALIAGQSLVIQLHLFAALSALFVALFMLKGAKGTRVHRIVGWAWVALMMTTALSSFFIREIGHGQFSYIHILSGWVAFATPLGVWAARTHRVRLHQRVMTGLVIGGLFIAGALTFIPGRLMWNVFLG